MKKILMLCDGDNFPSGATRFIRQMRDIEPIYVKGLFINPIDVLEMMPVGFIPIPGPYERLQEQEKLLVKKSQDQFIDAFENAGIKYEIHPHIGEWNRELFVKESRFADLVVISEELFCANSSEIQPNFYMIEALRSSESPVVVVPEKFKRIDHLAFAYDGGKECMFAIKQFTYLFPNLTDLPSEFVHIKNEATDEIPERSLLGEYTFSHFEAQHTSKLHFDPKKYLTAWLGTRKNVFLVSGSFSRSAVSNVFKKSFADHVIAEHSCPILIAHFS
ncbi:MAG TPA: hypothetical protein VGG71_06295 [Chitinophagaceae bacterium]